MADLVRLTVVASQGESDVICGLLRSGGIGCDNRAADPADTILSGWCEILVSADDLEAAREMLAGSDADELASA
jgi:hypothetical protein